MFLFLYVLVKIGFAQSDDSSEANRYLSPHMPKSNLRRQQDMLFNDEGIYAMFRLGQMPSDRKLQRLREFSDPDHFFFIMLQACIIRHEFNGPQHLDKWLDEALAQGYYCPERQMDAITTICANRVGKNFELSDETFQKMLSTESSGQASQRRATSSKGSRSKSKRASSKKGIRSSQNPNEDSPKREQNISVESGVSRRRSLSIESQDAAMRLTEDVLKMREDVFGATCETPENTK